MNRVTMLKHGMTNGKWCKEYASLLNQKLVLTSPILPQATSEQSNTYTLRCGMVYGMKIGYFLRLEAVLVTHLREGMISDGITESLILNSQHW